MAFVIAPNEGLPALLRYMLKSSITGVFPWQLMLFVNDLVPDADTVFADLVEPSWTNYLRVQMDRAEWTDPVLVGNVAVSTWKTEPRIFTNGGGPTETVFGYAMLDNVANVLRFVQRLDDGDIKVVAPNASISILPRLTLTTEDLT